MTSVSGEGQIPFEEQLSILQAKANGEKEFSEGGSSYSLSEDGTVTKDGTAYAYASRYVVNAIMSDVSFSQQFKGRAFREDSGGREQLYFYRCGWCGGKLIPWSMMPPPRPTISCKTREQMVYDTYSPPSKAHLLGTDKTVWIMLTRLMYGGRVSLYIGILWL